MPRSSQCNHPTTQSLASKGIAYTVLEHNQEQMFQRFRRNTLPRSLAASFGTTEREAIAIINRQIDARLFAKGGK